MRIIIKNFKICLLVVATVFILVIDFGCGKNNESKPCRTAPYGFSVTSEFSPQREIYNVGDTIYLNSIFAKTLLNAVTNQQADYSNSLGIGGNLAIGFLDSNAHVILYALSKFKIINVLGSSTPIPNAPDGGLNIFYKEDVNYSFKIGIICLSKGIFRFGLSDLGSQGLIGRNCTNAGFNMNVTNSNKNLNLFQFAIGYYPDALAEKKIYCFRVQ